MHESINNLAKTFQCLFQCMYKICMNHLSTQNAAFQCFPLKIRRYMAGLLPIRRKTQNNQSIYRQSQKALKQQDRSKVILIYVQNLHTFIVFREGVWKIKMHYLKHKKESVDTFSLSIKCIEKIQENKIYFHLLL